MNDELYHHGIKGQKWGVRRTPEQLGYATRVSVRGKRAYVTSGPMYLQAETNRRFKNALPGIIGAIGGTALAQVNPAAGAALIGAGYLKTMHNYLRDAKRSVEATRQIREHEQRLSELTDQAKSISNFKERKAFMKENNLMTHAGADYRLNFDGTPDYDPKLADRLSYDFNANKYYHSDPYWDRYRSKPAGGTNH